MILYRIQVLNGEDWANEWFPTLFEARKALSRLQRFGFEARLDKVQVPKGRAGMCAFLNESNSSHVNLPGERL